MKKENVSKRFAVTTLILNLLFPGVGTLFMGKVKEGIWQLALLICMPIAGVIISFTIIGAIIGIPLVVLGPVVAWIWALINSIQYLGSVNK